MAKDADYKRLIHTSRWLKLRRDVLTAHPLCVECEAAGLIAPASEVHHITPVESGLTMAEKEALMFSPSNLKPLCHDCHVKAHIELGRSGRAATRRRSAEHLERFKKKFLD